MFKKMISLLGIMIFIFSIGTIPANAAPECGKWYGTIEVLCDEDTRELFCNTEASPNWSLELYDYNGYEVSRWTCGGIAHTPGTDIISIPVGDFSIHQFEEGESFSVYCIPQEEYIAPFPDSNVPIDLYLCLDYFPYTP